MTARISCIYAADIVCVAANIGYHAREEEVPLGCYSSVRPSFHPSARLFVCLSHTRVIQEWKVQQVELGEYVACGLCNYRRYFRLIGQNQGYTKVRLITACNL